MKLFFAIVMAVFFWACSVKPVYAAANTANVLSLNTATTNVTTSAFITLSSSIPVTPGALVIMNATSSVIKISYGASGSEIDLVSVGPTTTIHIPLSRHLVQGQRLAVEAVSATASTAYISVSLIP